MKSRLITEYIFFFAALSLVGVMVWQIFAPFITALALAAIIVVICYPLYELLLKRVSRQHRSIAAFLSTVIAFSVIVIPLSLASTVLVGQFVNFYHSVSSSPQLPIDSLSKNLQIEIQKYIPGFEFNLTDQIKQSLLWFTKNLGTIFAGTVSVAFTFMIALLGSFYLFRDGKRLLDWFVSISPLKDSDDRVILQRVARSIRSVVTGTVLVSIIQGVVATIGFSIFGISQPILWGSLGSLAALLPGVGTSGVMLPAIAYLVYVGHVHQAIGMLIYGVTAIIIIDNFIAPSLMSRGNNLHPFVTLISVLGGISLFGPIGFVIGPVVLSLFMVMIELYGTYVNVGHIPKS